MKMTLDWTASTKNHAPGSDSSNMRSTFRSQVLFLTYLEQLLGHTFCVRRREKSKQERAEKGIDRGFTNNIVSCVLIVIPTTAAVCFPGGTRDEMIIHEVVVLLYFFTIKICIGSRRKLHDLINQIVLFDRSLSETFSSAQQPGKNIWWGCLWTLLTLVFPLPILLYLGTQVFNLHSPMTPGLYFFGLFFHLVSTSQRTLIFVYFFAVSRAMKVRFRLIKSLLEDELQKTRPSAVLVESMRMHHARLSVLVDTMNASVCKRLIFPILQMAAEFLYIFFRYVYRDHFQIHPFILVNLFTHLLELQIVTSASEKIILESRMPLYVMRAVIINDLSFLCQSQILTFQDQILAVPVQISAGGFFYLDNKLLTELALLIVTYCTVILQLMPNEDEAEKMESDLTNIVTNNTV